MRSTEIVSDARRAASLLAHPLRPRILAAARQPVSAAELARAFNLPRQRINYHVRQLAAAGFLEAVGQQRKRNMVEQQYHASARAYALSPDLLGVVAAQPAEEDATSATHLLGLYAQAQTELAGVVESAQQAGLRVRAYNFNADLYFENAKQRADFTEALSEALYEVIERFSGPSGGRFRLLVGCYPGH